MEVIAESPRFLLPAPQQQLLIDDSSGIAQARRSALKMAAQAGFSDFDAGKVGIVVSELATNLLKHVGHGELLLRSTDGCEGSGIEIFSLDRGAGIRDLEVSMRDGVSTTGTAGSGLGAMRRLADEFEVYTQPGHGSVFYLALYSGTRPAKSELQCGSISLAKAGEDSCGDAWYCGARGDTAMLAVADGLGHGPDAARAARAVMSVLEDRTLTSPSRILNLAHQRARSTRGAAVAFAALQPARHTLQYSALGNIAGSVCDAAGRRHLITHNGIVGYTPHKAYEMSAPWPPDAAVILHSDGLSAQWDLSAYPRLALCHPALICAVLYRDFSRRSDDATVVVTKRRQVAG